MKTLLPLLAAVALSAVAIAQDTEILDAKDLDTLRARKDTTATVEGIVMDIGTTQDGGITFLNIGAPKKQGFVAVVFKSFYDAFPDGFDKFRNQTVRVKGTIELFRDTTPQIQLKTPDQIEIVTTSVQ